MMRHEDIQTTMKYYADFDADELAEVINKAQPQNVSSDTEAAKKFS